MQQRCVKRQIVYAQIVYIMFIPIKKNNIQEMDKILDYKHNIMELGLESATGYSNAFK